MLTPYPSSIPVQSVKIVVDKLRGRSDESVKLADVVHAGWEVSGFALKNTIGDPGATVASFGSNGAQCCDNDELAKHLEGILSDTPTYSLPWSVVAMTLIKIMLEQWLRNS